MSVADRVAKLIALTASTNENEARNAAALACRLIREHGLRVVGERAPEPATPPPHPPPPPSPASRAARTAEDVFRDAFSHFSHWGKGGPSAQSPFGESWAAGFSPDGSHHGPRTPPPPWTNDPKKCNFMRPDRVQDVLRRSRPIRSDGDWTVRYRCRRCGSGFVLDDFVSQKEGDPLYSVHASCLRADDQRAGW